jgi:tetratricopeptide (TPR) repeat protein
MRLVLLTLSILLCSRVLLPAASSVSDSGVPAGWSALQYDNYGNDLLNQHKYAEARKYFDAAIRLAPNRWTAYYNRATAFQMEKNWTAEIQDLDTTIRLQPAFFLAGWDRSLAYLKLGDYAAALKNLDALARVTFETGQAGQLGLVLNQRAWLRATCPNASIRNGQLAVADAKKACELEKWKDSAYIDTLAAACAEAGDFDSAMHYEQQAITLNKSGSDESQKSRSPKLAEELAKANGQRLQNFFQRLELYKQHHPYRQNSPR